MPPIWPGSQPPDDGSGCAADENDDGQEKFRDPDLDGPEKTRAMGARERLLARIASSLNKAETEFLEEGQSGAAAGVDAEDPHVLVGECAELVRLYCSFPDPETRRQWLGLLKAAVTREPK